MPLNQDKTNWKWVIRIHQVVIGLLFLFQFFLHGDLKKAGILLLAIAGASLLIQGLVFLARPGLFGNKVTKHPHEVLKKLNG